jgi:hypothetical protein
MSSFEATPSSESKNHAVLPLHICGDCYPPFVELTNGDKGARKPTIREAVDYWEEKIELEGEDAYFPGEALHHLDRYCPCCGWNDAAVHGEAESTAYDEYLDRCEKQITGTMKFLARTDVTLNAVDVKAALDADPVWQEK